MSRPRYRWWGYVKAVIRAYPELSARHNALHSPTVTPTYAGAIGRTGTSDPTGRIAVREMGKQEQREFEAVRRAVRATVRMSAGRDRLRIIEMVLWRGSHTLEGAALAIPCSYMTARRYHCDFICLVARNYGFQTHDEPQEPKK